MNILHKCIKWLAYNSLIVRLTRLFMINNFLSKAYCKLFRPTNTKLDIVFENIDMSFIAKDNREYRYIEGNFSKGYLDERVVLEHLIQILRSGNIVFDIGANIGIHAIFMAKAIGEKGVVIAFEPEKHYFDKLQSNIKINSLKNLIPLNIALGDSFSEAILFHDSLTTGAETGGQSTIIMPGDIVVKDKKLPTPNVVKIDVEGYEYHVIRGLAKTLQEKKCEVVCCEIHPSMLPAGLSSDDVIGLLTSYGFNRIETYPRGNTFHAFCSKSGVLAQAQKN